MLSQVHHRMGIELTAQPEIERQIVMRRHQIGIVIAAFGIDVVAACRLNPDHDIAEPMQTEVKRIVLQVRILPWITQRCSTACRTLSGLSASARS